ncbi:hypothetical protein WJU23_05500 [Prosthecobacter sp. SYSU 5D2]|uniref:hypothetical protein n=1 Tax=Prosthecobacter sp. SYSU 5D2 TaxID=3134134 RepID=UPI0031FED994
MSAFTAMKTLVLTAILGLLALPAAAQVEVEVPTAEKVAVLADKRIAESSGIARSLRHPGIFWTHNDSGGEPCLFAINQKGETVAKVRVPTAANFDWEDITQGPDEKGQPCLFIGDIGDNLKRRASIQIYRIPEPDLPEDAEKEVLSAEPETWHVSYPDGRHNAECLMMHPLNRHLFIVTKTEDGRCALYRVPEDRISGQAMKLIKMADLNFPSRPREGKRPGMACMATAADFSPDGSWLVIGTYSYLHEWKLSKKASLAQSLAAPARIIQPPLTKQMEAVCYDEDGASLWFTSEQLPVPLYRLSRK